MPRLYANGAYSTLAGGLTDVATTLSVAVGEGARFPTPTGGDTFDVTLENAALNFEIASCTARTGDVLTIVRGQQGTTAAAFAQGDRVELRVTATALTNLADTTEPINLTIQSAIPSTPAAGIQKLYSRYRAGRAFVEMLGPAGVDTSLQPSLFGNTVILWGPTSGTTISPGVAMSWTARNAGTGAVQSHPSRSSTNIAAQMSRANFGTGTTAIGSSGVQSTQPAFWRGNAAGLGGFFLAFRFCLNVAASDLRVFLGLSALNAALNGEPSVQANSIAIGADSTDANLQLICRNATTTTKTDTGISKTGTTAVYDVLFFARPNDTTVTVRVVNVGTGVVEVDDVVLTTNLPVNTTFLFIHAQIQSVTGTTAKLLGLNRIYGESDV
jgi:hypothetical protein